MLESDIQSKRQLAVQLAADHDQLIMISSVNSNICHSSTKRRVTTSLIMPAYINVMVATQVQLQLPGF